MQTGILHPQLENTIGSDHIKQVASFVIEGTVFEIITHNMLNKCHAGSQTNNAWNINESPDQYIARLEYLVNSYKHSMHPNTAILALQEAPGSYDEAEFLFKKLNLSTNWKYQLNKTGFSNSQSLMLIYNEAILGNLISSDTHLENRAASYSFNIQDINVLFINVHLLYNESHDKGRSYSNLQKIEELMSTQGSDLK